MAYTTIDDPSAYFQAAIYTGNGDSSDDTNAIVNDGNSNLQPDFIWIKRRDADNGHQLLDSTRGVTKIIGSELSSAETTLANRLASFDTDGFTVQSSSGAFNAQNEPFVAWQWKANGGTTTSVSASGTGANCINASTHQVNQDAGFSIVTYTGRADQITVHQTTNLTHGLGVIPDLTIMKKRDGTGDWVVMGKYITTSSAYSANEHLHLNTTAAVSDAEYTGYYAPTSTYIRLGDALVNDTGDDYVCYAFAEKQGYSKFGKYVGNGSANGSFVYTGFKPAMVITKKSSATGNWTIYDNKRDPFNVADTVLLPNTTDADQTVINFDFVSNGFKCRNSGSENENGTTYVYMAFAENPFVTSTGIPTTAR